MVLRILQGFSAGGKWGGAALMAVQHAPRGERGFWGAYSQFGVLVGMILATLVLFLLRLSMSPEQFLEWGWRVPFLLSVALIVVGHFIGVSMVKEPRMLPWEPRRPMTPKWRNPRSARDLPRRPALELIRDRPPLHFQPGNRNERGGHGNDGGAVGQPGSSTDC